MQQIPGRRFVEQRYARLSDPDTADFHLPAIDHGEYLRELRKAAENGRLNISSTAR